jgi:GTPase involved in cell partitioning and DNA repair
MSGGVRYLYVICYVLYVICYMLCVMCYVFNVSQLNPPPLAINQELELFNPALALKTQVVVVNKVDLPEVKNPHKPIK